MPPNSMAPITSRPGFQDKRRPTQMRSSRHSLGPLRNSNKRKICSAEPCADTAEKDRRHARKNDPAAERVSRIVIFANRAQVGIRTRVFQEPPHSYDDCHSQINEIISIEWDSFRNQNVAEQQKAGTWSSPELRCARWQFYRNCDHPTSRHHGRGRCSGEDVSVLSDKVA